MNNIEGKSPLKTILYIYQERKQIGIVRELEICRLVSNTDKFSDRDRAEIALMGSHQERLNIPSRNKFRDLAIDKLVNSALWNNEYKTFELLYGAVCEIIGNISYIGPLTKYDVAKRIGVMMNKEVAPQKYVYLHSGALEGAQRLLKRDLPKHRDTSTLEESSSFQVYFGKLSPLFVEDLLCTMKDYFSDGKVASPQNDKKSSGCYKLYCSQALKEKINKELYCKSE